MTTLSCIQHTRANCVVHSAYRLHDQPTRQAMSSYITTTMSYCRFVNASGTDTHDEGKMYHGTPIDHNNYHAIHVRCAISDSVQCNVYNDDDDQNHLHLDRRGLYTNTNNTTRIGQEMINNTFETLGSTHFFAYSLAAYRRREFEHSSN